MISLLVYNCIASGLLRLYYTWHLTSKQSGPSLAHFEHSQRRQSRPMTKMQTRATSVVIRVDVMIRIVADPISDYSGSTSVERCSGYLL